MSGRLLGKDIVKGKSRNFMDSLDRVPNLGEKTKTGDKLPKRNSHSSDGDKYMSYIKVYLSTYFVFFSESNTLLTEKRHGICVSYLFSINY